MGAATTDQPRIFARKVAIRIGGALLVGFGLLILTAGIDAARRKQLETFQQVTAVEDRNYFSYSEELRKSTQPVVSFRGEPLYSVGSKPIEVRDTKMLRMGLDDSGKFFVYSSRENVPAAEGEVMAMDGKVFFLKLAQGEYLKTRTEPSKK